MLSKQDQIRFLDRQLSALVTFLTAFRPDKPGKKEIHDLRIDIKKIQALIEVNKIRGYDAGTLSFLGISELFRTTGRIRNSQVIISSLEKTGIREKKVSRYHKDVIREFSQKLASEIPRYLKTVNELRQEMFSAKLKSISEVQLISYHLLKRQYLARIFKTPLDPQTLHEGRKQIKHILYIKELVVHSTRKPVPLHYDHLDELQSLIGKWHDSVVFLDFLDESGIERKQALRKELTAQIKDQFDQINSFCLDKKKLIFISRT